MNATCRSRQGTVAAFGAASGDWLTASERRRDGCCGYLTYISAGATYDVTVTCLVRPPVVFHVLQTVRYRRTCMSTMERCRAGRLVIVTSLYLMMSYDSVVTTSGIDDHHDYSDDVINAARCRVRCLSLFQVGLFVAFDVAVCEKLENISRSYHCDDDK